MSGQEGEQIKDASNPGRFGLAKPPRYDLPSWFTRNRAATIINGFNSTVGLGLSEPKLRPLHFLGIRLVVGVAVPTSGSRRLVKDRLRELSLMSQNETSGEFELLTSTERALYIKLS